MHIESQYERVIDLPYPECVLSFFDSCLHTHGEAKVVIAVSFQ